MILLYSAILGMSVVKKCKVLIINQSTLFMDIISHIIYMYKL